MHFPFPLANYPTAGSAVIGSRGRAAPDSYAAFIVAITKARSLRSLCGVKCKVTIEYWPSLSCLSIVRSQASGLACQRLESISTATPASGHQASGQAMNVPFGR